MQIQWYPGHMYKAGKEIKNTLQKIDLIIEVLDARLPFSSENPKLSQLRGDKPCIKLLNKSDLADDNITKAWQDYLEQTQQIKTLAVNINTPEKTALIPELCHKIFPAKQNYQSINALIMGIPNVGKSTIINTLAGRIIAKTGNEPAVTKRQQQIRLKQGLILFDTPGMLWPNLENKNSGYRLAVSGAIKDTALHHDDVAFFAAEYLLHQYPQLLQTRFKLPVLPTTEAELMQIIGRQRGCLRAGGNIDMDKTAKILMAEIRAGILGKISWETPKMMETELIELKLLRDAKVAKKQAKINARNRK